MKMGKLVTFPYGCVLVLVLVTFCHSAPNPEPPVENYMANFYDPHPHATYGAHPFHFHEEDALADEEEEHPIEVQARVNKNSNTRRRYQPAHQHQASSSEYLEGPLQKNYYQSRKFNSQGSKYRPRPQSHDHEIEDLDDTPVAHYNARYSTTKSLKGRDAYHPDGWFNSEGGKGYEASGPSEVEHDEPMNHYAFSAGDSYSPTGDKPSKPGFLMSLFGKGSKGKLRSNGYGQDPFFTFGPKKHTNKKPSYSSHSDDDYSAGTRGNGKSSRYANAGKDPEEDAYDEIELADIMFDEAEAPRRRRHPHAKKHASTSEHSHSHPHSRKSQRHRRPERRSPLDLFKRLRRKGTSGGPPNRRN